MVLARRLAPPERFPPHLIGAKADMTDKLLNPELAASLLRRYHCCVYRPDEQQSFVPPRLLSPKRLLREDLIPSKLSVLQLRNGRHPSAKSSRVAQPSESCHPKRLGRYLKYISPAPSWPIPTMMMAKFGMNFPNNTTVACTTSEAFLTENS